MTARIALPGTTLHVSPICLGGNRLGGDLDRDQSFALLDAFVAAGGNFVDTAHIYADWLPDVERSCSEKTIGRWRHSRGIGDEILVATKIGHPVLGHPDRTRLDEASLRQDVSAALENLGLARLDLVYLHRDDPARDAAEILGVLEEMRAEGLILHYAASNWSAPRLQAATDAAQAHGWDGFRANQSEWSLAARVPGTAAPDLHGMDRDMIAWHRATGAAAIPYSAQAQGYFDKLDAGALTGTVARNYDSEINRMRAVRLSSLADRHGVTPTQVMLALFRFAGLVVVPVVGARTAAQIASSLTGIGLDLAFDEAGPLLVDLVGPDVAVLQDLGRSAPS